MLANAWDFSHWRESVRLTSNAWVSRQMRETWQVCILIPKWLWFKRHLVYNLTSRVLLITTDVWRVCCHCVGWCLRVPDCISQNAKIEPLSRVLAYNHAYRKTPKFGAFHAEKRPQFSLRASIKSEPTIDLCTKKWGSNNTDWPHTRESGGQLTPWPHAFAVYGTLTGRAQNRSRMKYVLLLYFLILLHFPPPEFGDAFSVNP